MPCFRGVAIFIGSEYETKRLPEFPHPDSSSVNLASRDSGWPFNAASSMPSFATDPDLTKMPKTVPRVDPRISVYVPSIPGTKFWIQYSVTRIPKPPCQLYFKMILNGRNITNWGINPVAATSGTVAKALFEPDHRWQCKDEKGKIVKPDGIEVRFFQFLRSADASSESAAEQGGVIEVQVFRAKGKKRRTRRLCDHSSQEKFGISTPSGGLLDNPEDAAYFDWLLTDPKDAPYASFRFHYQPMAKLRLLNLVPPTRDRTSFSFPVPPISTITKGHGDAKVVQPGDSCPDDEDAVDNGGMSRVGKAGGLSIVSPPEIFPVKGGSMSRLAQPSKMARDGLLNVHLNRPLPPLPPRRLVPPAPRESPGGSLSDMVSISPSLHHARGDESLLDTEVKYGVGTEVSIRTGTPNHPLKAQLVDIPTKLSQSPTSDYESSAWPPTPTRPPHPLVGRPTTYQPMTSKAVERQIGQFSPANPFAGKNEADTSNSVFLNLPESEWMKSSRGSSCPRTTDQSPRHGPDSSTNRVDNQPTIARFPPPRGLLGTDLSQIPLTGPSGDLMKKLRSEDPFRGI